jgi:hypothetical protein
MKTKMFSVDQINQKPDVEFDWSSQFINELCRKADMDNPSTDYYRNQYSNPHPTPRIPVIHPPSSSDWPKAQKQK